MTHSNRNMTDRVMLREKVNGKMEANEQDERSFNFILDIIGTMTSGTKTIPVKDKPR